MCARVFGATMRITKEKTTAIRGELEPRLWAKLVEPVKPFFVFTTHIRVSYKLSQKSFLGGMST